MPVVIATGVGESTTMSVVVVVLVEVLVDVDVVVADGAGTDVSLKTSAGVGGLAKSANVKTGGSELPPAHALRSIAERSSDLRIG